MNAFHIKPTKIKDTCYLLIPKTIAQISNVDSDTVFEIMLDYIKPQPILKITQLTRKPNVRILTKKIHRKKKNQKKLRRKRRTKR